MITKVVLGEGTILDNVDDVQEVVQNNGNFILNGLTLNLIKKENIPIELPEIESIFSRNGVLSNIKVYNKDITGNELDVDGQEIPVYGEEYISLETSIYTGVQSIYKHISDGRVSIQLTSDPTKIADDKYNELVAVNERLEQTILELTMLLGGM